MYLYFTKFVPGKDVLHWTPAISFGHSCMLNNDLKKCNRITGVFKGSGILCFHSNPPSIHFKLR